MAAQMNQDAMDNWGAWGPGSPRPSCSSSSSDTDKVETMNDQPIFDHEKLDVYQVELSFIAWSSVLLSEIRAAGRGFVLRG